MRNIPVLMLVVALAACGGDGEQGRATQPEPSVRPEPGPVTTPSDGTTVPSPDLDELAAGDRETVETALADLAERMGADVEQIRMVSFERVTWSDGSLGCPEPGKMYTQALVEGSRTVLELEGRRFSYHAGSDSVPFLCERPGPEPSNQR